MPKYISGRSKRRPQDQLSDDRYQYLGVDQSEPNLGDPVFPGETPPFGQQYITVSIEGYPGERYWIPNQGGIIPGSISIFDESNLVGAINSITQLNIVGAAVSAFGNSVTKATITLADSLTYSFSSGQKITQDGNTAASGFVFESTTNSGTVTLTTVTGAFNASGELEVNGSGIGRTPASIPTNTTTVGVAATIEVTPEYFSTNTQVVFNNNDEFDGALGLVYQNNSATDSSNVGLASVGIGTTFARRTLHVDGDIKLTGSIEDYNNSLGNTSDILVKNSSGGIEWIEQNSLNVGAAGTYYEVQFHSGTGTLAGADKLVYRSDLNGGQIGIGSTIPTKLLDVLGDSIFTGDVTFDGSTDDYDALWDRSENAFIVKDNAKFAAGTDSDLEIYHTGITGYIDSKTGSLYIRNNVDGDHNGVIVIEAKKNKSSIVCYANNSVELHYNDSRKAYTDPLGFRIDGRLYVDDGTSEFHGDVRFDGNTTGRDIYFDESENSLYAYDNAQFRVGTGGDVRIYHDSSNTYIEPKSDGDGDLIVGSATTDIAKFVYNGGVSLYYQDVLKFDTIGAGVTVYGNTETQSLDVSGQSTFNDANVTGVATIDNIKIYDNNIETISGNLILDSIDGTTQVNDIIYVNDETESTSKDNGSIYTEGGVGIEKNLNVGGSVKVTGITTLGVTTLTDLTAQQLNVSGITTLGVTTLTDLTAQQLNVSGITTLGVTTLTNVTAQQLFVSGISTLGVTTLTNVTSQQLFVSGISTLGNVFIQPIGTGASVGEKEPGVSGVVTFYGDGSGLRNVVAIGTGIDIQNSGVDVGSASTINFNNNLTGSLDDGIYTINASDVYWVQNSTGIHTLGSVGIGTTTINNDFALEVVGEASLQTITVGNFIVDWRANGEWYLPSEYTRQLSPQTGNAITSGTLGPGATRTTDAEVYDYVWDNYDAFDLDGDGIVSYNDAIMLSRYLANSNNPLRSYFNNVWPYNATRNTDSEIISFITSNLSIYDVDGDGNVSFTTDALIVARIFGATTHPSFRIQEVFEKFDFSNDAFLSPDDGGGAQFRRLRGVGIGTTTLRNNDLEVYGKVSIADTTSNAGGARYISTEAPTAGVGEEGDIWYDVSSTSDVSGTNGNIPIGGIIMWYGTIANIPASWALCDGNSHSTAIGTIVTPDLRSRFIVGAGTDTQNVWGFDVTTGAQTFTDGQTSVGVGSTGGEVAHQLTVAELASHTHTQNGDYSSTGGGTNAGGGSNNPDTGSAGDDKYHENRPPYYALAYIMRIV